MKKRTLALLMALTLSTAGSTAVFAEEETESAAAETEAAEEETEAAAEAGSGELSDDLYSFQVKIDGEVYTFPMTYDEFTAKGWELRDMSMNITEEDTLEPNQYTTGYYERGNEQCTVDILSFNNSVVPVTECLVGGFDVEDYYWKIDEGEVILPGGIKRGEATLEDIEAAYGTPTDVYEGDLYTKYTYEKDFYQDIELYVDKELGVLDRIDLRNFTEPEGFEAGEVSEEVPEDITAYKAPEALGDSLEDYQVELDGVLYQLPVPVSVMVENGWTLDESSSDESVPAKSSGWAYLYKGGQKFHTMVSNNADYATVPQNCWVEGLEAGDYDMNLPMKVSGGFEIGMTEEDLTAALDASGMEYEVEEGSSYNCYKAGEDLWNGYEFYTCTDEECTAHTPGTVYKIAASSEVE